MKLISNIEITLDHINDGLILWIGPHKPNTLVDAENEAAKNNEARIQLIEGCYYDYHFNNSSYYLGDIGESIIQQHKKATHLGTISPNIFVGTLTIPIHEKSETKEVGKIELEVQSIKSSYRDDYRDMLEFITEKCTDLLLQVNSPVSQYFDVNFAKDSQTLYQKFIFIKSVIGTDEFAEALHRIVTSPVTKWSDTPEANDIRSIKRFSNSNLIELTKGTKRSKLPYLHYLNKFGIYTIPDKINSIRKKDSVDTLENRFIKHALEVFLKFCIDIHSRSMEHNHKKMQSESLVLIRELENHLHHSFFKEISTPTTLKLNSPVLQRKEGYREILRIWLMFDLAAKLIWTGGDDIYKGGKKDIATLYEYWLFFKLLDLLQSTFKIESEAISELIKQTPDGLNLQLKQGRFTALYGTYNSGYRKLNIRFNYNRTFTGRKKYPDSGSWSISFRPDYTLSIWPYGISEDDAEKQELIVHIHFDAKYKIANLTNLFEQQDDDDLNEIKYEHRKEVYKNADLLKMHAYKDAIRRTGGAYVLYPGDLSINQKGFHEIIPGLGAFPVRPSKRESGIGELKTFIQEIVDHFINRVSQREKFAFRTFDIFKNPPELNNIIKESLPETYNSNRDLIPDETFILIGYYHTQEQYEWIKRNSLYNFRLGSGNGSLVLDKETVCAKYLLLHTAGESVSSDLWKIVSKGPKVYSKMDLINKNYPKTPTQENYLVIQIEPVLEKELKNVTWDFKKLYNYSKGRGSALPFTASLAELMNSKFHK